jgi:hypothetical protein
MVPSAVGTYRADLIVAHIHANPAITDLASEAGNGISKLLQCGPVLPQQVQNQAQCGFVTNPGQGRKFFYGIFKKPGRIAEIHIFNVFTAADKRCCYKNNLNIAFF